MRRLQTAGRNSWLYAAAIVVAAGANFLWGLGSSSLFGDEVYSLRDALAPLGDSIDTIKANEVSPPLYFWLLHFWIELTGSTAEAAIRAPSAVAGLALVGATGWLGWLVGGRRVALLAALLTALSPLVLLYAQQARVYPFAMLAVCIAIAALLQARRSASPGRWLAASGVAAVLAIWFHYIGVFVAALLCAYLLARGPYRMGARIAYCVVCAAALLAVLPLALEQGRLHPGGLIVANLSLSTAIGVLATPFDTRTYFGLIPPRLLGAAIVVGAAIAWAWWGRTRYERDSWALVLAVAIVPLVALIAFGALGKNVVISRYAAVVAPAIVVLIAGAIVAAPWRAAAPLLASALALALAGSLAQHRRDGFWPDARSAAAYVAEGWQPGDALVTPRPGVALRLSLQHYAAESLPPGARVVEYGTPELDAAIAERRRLWTATGPLSREEYAARSARVGYEPLTFSRFEGNDELQMTLAVPTANAR